MVNKESTVRAKKAQQIKRIYELLGKYTQVIAVTLDNVGSLQCQQIRRECLNAGAHLVIGKNTIVKKALNLRLKEFDTTDEDLSFLRDVQGGHRVIPELEALLPIIKLKIGFIFTDVPVFQIKPIIESNQVKAAAKIGMISDKDIIIPPGPTGMDPSQISFFHALNISTKIQKSQIEITKDFTVCKQDAKIGASAVALLQKMNLRPFIYKMNVFCCYQNGSVLGKEVISLSPADIVAKFQAGVKNLAAISLETGYQTEASAPYAIINAFKNLAAIGMQVDYKFAQLAALGSGAPAASSGGAAKQDAQVEEAVVEEPEEDMDMGGLFD